MARRKTIADLEHEIENLRPYQELVFLLLRDKLCARRIRTAYGPSAIVSGEQRFWLYGANRASGGIVVNWEGQIVLGFAVDVCIRWNASGDPYLRDCASQIHRAQKEALETRRVG
jgi:hypothetical protein